MSSKKCAALRIRGVKMALGLAVCSSLIACAVSPPPAVATDAIAAQLERFLDGVSVGDATVHDWFWSDALIYTSSDGSRFGKAAILANAASSEGEGRPAVRYTAEDVRIRVYGEVATLAFRLVAAEPGGRRDYLNSATLRRTDQTWQVVQWQATRVPEPDER